MNAMSVISVQDGQKGTTVDAGLLIVSLSANHLLMPSIPARTAYHSTTKITPIYEKPHTFYHHP